MEITYLQTSGNLSLHYISIVTWFCICAALMYKWPRNEGFNTCPTTTHAVEDMKPLLVQEYRSSLS